MTIDEFDTNVPEWGRQNFSGFDMCMFGLYLKYFQSSEVDIRVS